LRNYIKESFDFNIIDNTNKNKQEKILRGAKVYIIRSYIERLLNRDTSLLEDKEFIKIISSNGIYKVRSKEEIRSIYEAGLDVVGTRFYLGWLNTSEITDMSELFRNMDGDPELKGIDKWDVSNVKNMKAMFLGCSSFDEDLGNWNTSNVINMS
jgi:surface protein